MGDYLRRAYDEADRTAALRAKRDGESPAIEATLGRRECRNISKVVDKYGQARFACSECGAWLDSRMLWNPEYPNGESPFVKDCTLNFCPNCGRHIVEVDG